MLEATLDKITLRYMEIRKLALVAVGIIAGQVVLYGPALVGSKVLLPLGCLAEPGRYIPHSPGAPEIESTHPVLSDLVLFTEPPRLFAARELSAGRLPRWTPYEYGGVPFTWPIYSPHFLLSILSESPVSLAWAQIFAALVAGFGVFAFCRRALKISYWPSVFAAWCYPITGWFVLFQGYSVCVPVIWLPWLCYAVDRTIQGAPAAVAGLAITTALVFLSRNLDVAGQVFLVSGLLASWRAWDVHRDRCVRYLVGSGGLRLVLGFGLGLLLAAPHLLPVQDYAKTSDRLSRRRGGTEERPPVGVAALPQFVLPDMYGAYAEKGTCPLLELAEGNLLESPAAGYTGLLATILLAPWALLGKRRRSESIFFLLLAGFGACWALNVPGAVQVLRLPGLNIMSHNRLVFATSFAILVLAAIGLENLLQGDLSRRPRQWPQLLLLSALLGWCLYRMEVFPEPLASAYEVKLQAGTPDVWLGTIDAIHKAQAWFSGRYQRAAVLSACGLAIILLLHYWPSISRRMFPVIGALIVADLLLFGYGRRVPQDPSLYYPEVPALRNMSAALHGRVIGIDCLPASIAQAIGLMDVRGCDGFDPERWVKLLTITSARKNLGPSYAPIQSLSPNWKLLPPDSIQLSPVLDMLSVRYAIFRGTPGAGIRPRFQSDDYWVLENRSALPRVFIPRRVRTISDDDETLRMLALPQFDAREVAYVDIPIDLPMDIRGHAEIREESPTRITVETQMDTPGLLVLADRWDKGWKAYVNGNRTPILLTNYAIRGVPLPSGTSRVEFRYESSMVALGNGLAIGAITFLLGWIGVVVWRRRKVTPSTAQTSA